MPNHFHLLVSVLAVGCILPSPVHCGAGMTDAELESFVAGFRGQMASHTATYGVTKDQETTFLSTPSAARARESLLFYTSQAHVAGTPGDYETALHMYNKLKAAGIPDVRIEEHQVLLSYPTERPLVELESNGNKTKWHPEEASYSFDVTSADPIRRDSFNGYAPSGDVTGPLVYVNYGSVEDYEQLAKAGVSPNGCIVIVRYGGIFRGLKAMLAQRHGAAGVIIYSDPMDDGYKKGNTFPNGPWRPESGIQRGSVQFNSLCAGDPHGREEICGYKQDELIPQIPVQPLSYGIARSLLSAMRGAAVPDSWKGGLDIDYVIGGQDSGAIVRLKMENKFTVAPIWNVIGTIEGTGPEADELVVLGNHRDAWAFGAVDPNSGSAALEEVAHAFGSLLSQGWKPSRTVVLCSWDGEEYGLLGSTAFGEQRADQLKKHAVAYLNVDCAVAGPILFISATPSLHNFINSTVSEITVPRTDKPFTVDKFGRLGSGSDYTVFLDHLGVASADLTFLGDYGVYHSIYDSFAWMDHYGDPGFAYHEAAAKLWGLIALRLATMRDLPFDYSNYAHWLSIYTTELRDAIVTTLGHSVHQADSLLGDLTASVARIAKAADGMCDKRADPEGGNRALMAVERAFIDPEGLPQRKWFKHIVQAPGLYEGYAANVLPGALQAVKDKDEKLAKEQISRIAKRFDMVATEIEAARRHCSAVV